MRKKIENFHFGIFLFFGHWYLRLEQFSNKINTTLGNLIDCRYVQIWKNYTTLWEIALKIMLKKDEVKLQNCSNFWPFSAFFAYKTYNFYTCTLINRDRGLPRNIYLESNIFWMGAFQKPNRAKMHLSVCLWTQISL